eukprot:780836-Alexandrium_andersonii.AAC.1
MQSSATRARATAQVPWVGAPTGSPKPLVEVRCFAPNPSWTVATPACPTGHTALSAARNLQILELPHLSDLGAGGAARISQRS